VKINKIVIDLNKKDSALKVLLKQQYKVSCLVSSVTLGLERSQEFESMLIQENNTYLKFLLPDTIERKSYIDNLKNKIASNEMIK
jgi:hypothetical protein